MEKKSVNEARDYQTERFTKRILFKKGESVVFVLNFLPGQELPAHTHPGTDVYLLALEGDGTMTVNGEHLALAKGESLHIAGDETFAYANTGTEPVTLYVVLTKVPAPEYAQNL